MARSIPQLTVGPEPPTHCKDVEIIHEIAVYPRVPTASMFDPVACAILSKTFSLTDAALILIETQHPEEAYGLSRSIVECTLNLRYLTQDPEQRESRARAFANFFFKERQYWFVQAKEILTDPSILAEMNQYAAEKGIVRYRGCQHSQAVS